MNKLFILTICLFSANLAYNQQDSLIADFTDENIWTSNGAGTVEQNGNTAIFKNISDQEYKIRCKKKINYKKPFTLSMDIKIVNSANLDILLFLENKMPRNRILLESSVSAQILKKGIYVDQNLNDVVNPTELVKMKDVKLEFNASTGISIKFSQDKTNRMTIEITDKETGKFTTVTTKPYLILDNYNSLMLRPIIKRGSQIEISNFKLVYTSI